MNVVESYCQRVVKDVVAKIILEDGTEFIMCGEIVGGAVKKESIGPTFYQSADFKLLDKSTRNKIIECAYEEFEKFE